MARPNLLFLFTDEQRADTMAAYGNNVIETPNLNRLAQESTVFERAYVTQSVCTPSRSSILTGLYPHTNGCIANNIPLRPETACFPEMLSPGDYVTGYYGKWHLGDEIFIQHGFDEWRSIEDMYARYYSEARDRNERSSYYHFVVNEGAWPADNPSINRVEATRLPEEYGKPAYLAGEASTFIRENKDRPFALFVNFLEPHMPFFGPRDDQYDPAQITLPENFDALPTADQPLKARLTQQAYYDRGFGMDLKTEEDWRTMIARYWGLCSLVDTHAGRILQTLEECGLSDNTIVVYTSDHGDMMGSHRLIAKCQAFEEALRVPLLVRLPGQSAGRRVKQPVSQIDLVPTLLDLMGQSIPGHLEGESLAPALNSDAAPGRDVFIEWNERNLGLPGGLKEVNLPPTVNENMTEEEMAAAVRDPVRTVITADGWKFNCSPLGEHELYNLNDDPGERTNLAKRPEMLDLMKELRMRIIAWQKHTGDKVELPAL